MKEIKFPASKSAIAARIKSAARRANEEAELRRRAAAKTQPMPKELGGPKGLEPTRYGDWERKGLISDF